MTAAEVAEHAPVKALDTLPRLLALAYGPDVFSRKDVIGEAKAVFWQALADTSRERMQTSIARLLRERGVRIAMAYDFARAVSHSVALMEEMRTVRFGEVEPDPYSGPESVLRAVHVAQAMRLFLSVVTGEKGERATRRGFAVLSAAEVYAEDGVEERARDVLHQALERIGEDADDDILLDAAVDMVSGGWYTEGMRAEDPLDVLAAMMAGRA